MSFSVRLPASKCLSTDQTLSLNKSVKNFMTVFIRTSLTILVGSNKILDEASGTLHTEALPKLPYWTSNMFVTKSQKVSKIFVREVWIDNFHALISEYGSLLTISESRKFTENALNRLSLTKSG